MIFYLSNPIFISVQDFNQKQDDKKSCCYRLHILYNVAATPVDSEVPSEWHSPNVSIERNNPKLFIMGTVGGIT